MWRNYSSIKFYFLTIQVFICSFSFGQSSKEFIENEIKNIKKIPSPSYGDLLGEKSIPTEFDSSFSKIVMLGKKAIPHLIKKLNDTTIISLENPCHSEDSMKTHDLVWFLIQEIEPFPYYRSLQIQFCLQGDCEHFPQGFFNFIHSTPRKFANRYKKYFYSKARKKYLRSKGS